MSCYVFRVLTTKKGKPPMRKTWLRRPNEFRYRETTCTFSGARLFDEELCGPIIPCALQWEKDLGVTIVPIEVREVGAELLAEMWEARAKAEGRVETV